MNRFTKDLLENVYCRIGVSKIHGVGVIAVRDIPKGIDPMKETRTIEFETVPATEILDNPEIPEGLKKLVVDMCPENEGVFDVPPCSLNEIGVSFYLNHSNEPNMEERDGYFFTLREIKEGEELTVDYGTYGEMNL